MKATVQERLAALDIEIPELEKVTGMAGYLRLEQGLHGSAGNDIIAVRERLVSEIETLNVQQGNMVRCEACGVLVDSTTAEGWQRTVDDCDLCPPCWTAFVEEAEAES